ncbi:putative nuclease HARBI1 [Spodoptera litura]|uniref:Nuclease HARBI1 n=1 Tax=Spodoptera litura TaxID=69820 RepID=A0A9J7EBD2_SPOLT|nr:putative nuclease HARBI1 [Spodoptera litura]
MARLALPFVFLQNARRMQLKIRRNERRLARYMDKAFSMGDEEFVANYRVPKSLFNEIYEELRPYLPVAKRRSDISPKYKLLVALSFFATGSYQKLVGSTFGTLMSQQSVSKAINDTVIALNQENILKKWVKFPQTRSQRDLIKRRFYEKFGIPAVLGCIDGTHVAIVRPSENEERFFNRKHFHSRNVMIICDADLNILSVDASFGGATHDSFIWNQHSIRSHLITLNDAGENVYFLGDSGYAQRTYMMTPIVDAAEGSPEELYNKMHCSARNVVERTIGVLKNRWRCLLGHRVLHYHPIKASKIINSCCVLHNICNQFRKNDHYDFDIELRNQNESSSEPPEARVTGPSIAELRRGIEKRNSLVQQLWAARR